LAQSVKRLTLDFRSGHDLRVIRLSPTLGSALGVGPAWDSLSPSASSLPCPRALSKTNKQTTKQYGTGAKTGTYINGTE